VFVDHELNVVHVSDQWVKDFCFMDTEVVGKSLYELFDDLSPKWERVLKNCLRGKGKEVGIERHIAEDKKERWFEWVNIPWYDENDEVIGVIIQTEDITTKVLNELKLEKLEILLSEKSQIAKIGSWEYNAVKDELYWCDMTKVIHEVAEDYEPDIDCGIHFYKEGFSRNTIAMAIDRAMIHGTPWNEKLQLITAKGREIWVIAAGKPLFKNGKYVGLIGTFQDITEQVHSETKTKESEQLLRTVVDNLPLNVYIKDLESRKVLVNKSECEFLEVNAPEELLGKDDFAFYDKETAEKTVEEDRRVMQSLKPVLAQESICVRKNGESTTFLTSKIPLIGDHGAAYGLLGISLDISDLKQKEEELRDLINVTSLQNKKLINFAHIVSHNLRSHTANFSMLLDFLVVEKNEEEKNNIINMLITASDNLLETLDNLNEVVAISTNVNQEKQEVCLNEKIGIVRENLEAFLKNNNAKIINEVPENTCIKAVPAYMESILMNFITNSVKYKDPHRDPVIRLSFRKNEQFSILTIEDNGLGIDLKKNGDKLFGMYKTFHDNSDARGIGLYITKNQIEAMNGKIITCSEVGKGTTFNIYFNEKN
ncbi:MAG: PAS domain-containing protein, partial [Bacteroidota bacterium]